MSKFVDGCTKKYNSKIVMDLKPKHIPKGIPCDKVKYFVGGEDGYIFCPLCGKLLNETYEKDRLMIRLFNPVKKRWEAYETHGDCMYEISIIFKQICEKWKKVIKDEI